MPTESRPPATTDNGGKDTRHVEVVAGTAVLVGAALAAPAAAAPAGTAPTTGSVTNAGGDVTAQTCYGDAVSYSTDAYFRWPAYPYEAMATSSCRDVNIKANRAMKVQVCYDNGTCRGWVWAPLGTWTVIASGVPDGTYFYLQVDRYSNGLVAY